MTRAARTLCGGFGGLIDRSPAGDRDVLATIRGCVSLYVQQWVDADLGKNCLQVPFYWAAQFTGAMCAAFVLKAVLHPIDVIGTTTPTGPHWHALVIEIVVTFNMMFVTCAVATDSRAVGELAGLAVGSAVCITSIFAGPVSGGSMNPARTLAPAVASNVYTGLWIYFLGPVIGTLSGAWTYTYIRFEEPPATNKDVPQRLSSFKLRRMQSQSLAADEFDTV